MKKQLAAIVISLAMVTAMAAPAMAASAYVTPTDHSFGTNITAEEPDSQGAETLEANHGKTYFFLQNASGEMSATVPLKVRLVADNDGTLTGPTVYSIKNTGMTPLAVTNIATTAESPFALGSGTDANSLKIVLTPGTGTAATLAATNALTGWNITGSSTDVIAFTGSKMGPTTANLNNEVKAFDVVYTIAAL